MPLFISYRSSGERFINYQANSSCEITSVILMTTLFYKALILQGEIWCWSLLGLKGLRGQTSFPLTKSLTKMSKEWPRRSRMGELPAQRTWWNSIFLWALKLVSKFSNQKNFNRTTHNNFIILYLFNFLETFDHKTVLPVGGIEEFAW